MEPSGGTAGSSDSTEAEVDTGVDDTSAAPVCGNEIVEAGESCDDGVETATCNGNCTLAGCGDGLVNAVAGEECDGDILAGGTCEGLGFDVGTLACEAGCSYDVSECYVLPEAPVLELGFSHVKRFDFSWAAVGEAEYYQVLESAAPGEPYLQLGGDVEGQSVSLEMPLHLRWQASYVLRACNGGGCSPSSDPVSVLGSLAEAAGYFKASNTGSDDAFGGSVALSGDGNTLAIGAFYEDSDATGINGDQVNGTASNSGAIYVFVRNGMGMWSQQAYIKASNTDSGDGFGTSVALSEDGDTLAVGAPHEASNATGIDGNQTNDSVNSAGAVYVFVRDGVDQWTQQTYLKAHNTGLGSWFGDRVALSSDANTLVVGALADDDSGTVYVFVRDGMDQWSQQTYLKASNPDTLDRFGSSVAVSSDGNTLVVGAEGESSNATGVGGNGADDSAFEAGAAYVFVRDGMGEWSQQAYIKASNSGEGDRFGQCVALSGDGNTLAVGAYAEDSDATGIGGNQADNSASSSGAVYVYTRDGMGAWSQQAYVKASNTGADDFFGYGVALSGDGNTLAVGAYREDSNATGLGGNQLDDTAPDSGAVYLY